MPNIEVYLATNKFISLTFAKKIYKIFKKYAIILIKFKHYKEGDL
jgi:hypothetical protein